jgi:hypothetical protein
MYRVVLLVVIAFAASVVPLTSAAASQPNYVVNELQTNFNNALLLGISCAATGSCVAVGNGTPVGGDGGPLIETLSDGEWTPSSIGPASSQLSGIWCASISSCIAVGGPIEGEGSTQALVDTLSDGMWSTATSDLDPTGAVFTTLNAISCVTLTSCVAAGYYTDASGDSHALFESLSDGLWTPSTAPDPSGSESVDISSIQCPTTTSCFAVGSWSANKLGTYGNPLLESLDGTTWTSSTFDYSGGIMRSLSCPSATTCVAIGYGGSPFGAFTETLSGGTWTQGTIPDLTGTSMNGMVGISCTPDITSCVAIGGYRTPPDNSTPDTLIETLSDGAWTPTTGIDPSYGYGFPEAIACPDIDSCVGVGNLTVGANQTVPMAVAAEQPPSATPESSAAVLLPLIAVALIGGTTAVKRRRQLLGLARGNSAVSW